MKTTHPNRNTNDHSHLSRSPYKRPSARYPSLYEDFEPYFRRNRDKPMRASASSAFTTDNNTYPRNIPRSHNIRLFALLAIVAIIVGLMAIG